MTERLNFPVSGGRLLVTWKDCPAQFGPNDFKHNKRTVPGFLIIATGAQPSELWIADVFHQHFLLAVDAMRMIAHVIEVQLIAIPTHSVFFRDGYLQHINVAWSGTESIHYHMYLILTDIEGWVWLNCLLVVLQEG